VVVTHATSRKRSEGGSITSIEALVLGMMAAILVAITVPSYAAMRDRANDSTARAHVRQVAEAVETYRAEHGSYTGLAPATLARVDADLRSWSYDLTRSGPHAYCVDASAGGRTWHVAGPAGDVARGGCP
jgi:type IV pilus assembly protein PilE